MAKSKSSAAQQKSKNQQGNKAPVKKGKSAISTSLKKFALFGLAGILAIALVVTSILGIIYLSSTPIDRKSTVMTIGSHEVTYDEYVNMVLYWRDYFEQSGDVSSFMQSPSAQKTLLGIVEKYLIENYTLIEFGIQHGIMLTDADRARVNQAVSHTIDEMGGYDAFLRGLDSNYMNLDLYYAKAYIEEWSLKIEAEIRDGEFGDATSEEIRQFISEHQLYGVKHILIKAATGATDEETLAEAQKVLARVQSGEDFDMLRREYNGDPGQPDEGYIIDASGNYYDVSNNLFPSSSSSTFVDEFVQASIRLKVGEFSGLVKSEHGYHIILRVEIDPVIIKNTLALQEIKDNIVITYGRNYEDITFESIKWNFQHSYLYSDEPLPSPVKGTNSGKTLAEIFDQLRKGMSDLVK